MDTLRMSHLLHLLLTNHKPALCVGPTGTGKSLTLSSLLLAGMPASFVTHFLSCSARTTAAQTQEFVDSKMDKRRKGVFGPPLGKRLVLCVEDVNLPGPDAHGAQPPLELLRQLIDQGGWYDVAHIGEFRQLVDTTVVCAMGPPGGGRHSVSPRFQRHLHLLAFPQLGDDSRGAIFGTILRSWTPRRRQPRRHLWHYPAQLDT
ncbi:dynein axonemal heavy chain 1-like [Petromyzon marinus]|uniref:dynein axonemal heavy chain 1-like n=1 Tax=Petromyzon marinus TaxID=7757 RepID=UPI003F70F803